MKLLKELLNFSATATATATAIAESKTENNSDFYVKLPVSYSLDYKKKTVGGTIYDFIKFSNKDDAEQILSIFKDPGFASDFEDLVSETVSGALGISRDVLYSGHGGDPLVEAMCSYTLESAKLAVCAGKPDKDFSRKNRAKENKIFNSLKEYAQYYFNDGKLEKEFLSDLKKKKVKLELLK